MKKTVKKKKGMTLIEAIISVALLSILIIPISGVIMNTVKTNTNAEIKQNAAYVGQQILEEIGTYDNITLKTDGADTFFQLLDGYKIIQRSGGTYESEFPVNGLPDNYEVTVLLQEDSDVTYEDKNNLNKYANVRWKFEFTGNNYRFFSPTSTGVGEHAHGSGVASAKLIINVDPSGKIKLDNSLTEYTTNAGEANKVLLYLSDSTSATYPDVEVKNDSSNNIQVYVVKEKKSNNMKVSSIGGDVFIYNDLLAKEENTVGTLYNINVEIKERNTRNVIFSGHTTSNIVFN